MQVWHRIIFCLWVCPFVSVFASIRFLNRLVKMPCTCSNLFIFAGKLINLGLSGPTVCWALSLVLWAKHGQNTTVRSSVKGCIYGWEIDFKIDFYSSDSWVLKDKPLKIILSCFLNSFFRGTFSFQLILDSVLSLVLCAQ
jgi:hypothetical protein